MNNKAISSPLRNTKVNDRFWSKRRELLANEVIPYQWDILNDAVLGAEPSHAIENFKIAAGEVTGKFHGVVFQDSDVAKWIEAASYSLRSYPSSKLEKIIDGIVEIMIKAQQPDGYLNTYYTVAEPELRWKDFSFGHELYCAGHLMEAAVAYYQTTGKRKFLDMMCRYADYIDSIMGPEDHKMKVYCGHEEIELALIKLYRVTGLQRYLALSRFFIDERGKKPCFMANEPTFGGAEKNPWFDLTYCQAHIPVREQKKVEGHSVRAMYLYTAMADLALETGDDSLTETLRTLWRNLINCRMYITGGIGSQSYAERFTFDYDLPTDTAYAETCASIGLIFWAQRMVWLEADSQYADIMEKALYNGALSGISLDGKRYFYVNPLEVYPEAIHSRHDLQHVKTERQQWFGCACCPPNIARLISSIDQYIYSQAFDTIYTHLYIGSEARFDIQGSKVMMRQETEYPWDEAIKVSLTTEQPTEFTLALRVPGWCKKWKLQMNGITIQTPLIEKGYLKVKRLWNSGDQIKLWLDMPVELIGANPKVRSTSGKAAIQRGPIVYCLEEIDNGKYLWDVSVAKDAVFKVELSEELAQAPVIRGKAFRSDHTLWENVLYRPVDERLSEVEFRAIPYYLWGNRKPGEMLVWIRLR
jgi:DUF1680 family protein